MPTEYLREKINSLNSWIVNEEVTQLQHELIAQAAVKSTGDSQVDAAMQGAAQNAMTVVMGCKARLEVYREKHAELKKELEAQAVKPAKQE